MYPKLFKNILFVFFAVALCSLSYQKSNAFAFIRNNPSPSVAPRQSDFLKASVFINLTVRDFESATGQKLNLFQKIYFKIVQKQIRHDLKKTPDFQISAYDKAGKAKFKFNALWFVIASIIGPFGVLLAYTDRQKKVTGSRKDKLKSAWLGLIFFIIWFGTAFIF